MKLKYSPSPVEVLVEASNSEAEHIRETNHLLLDLIEQMEERGYTKIASDSADTLSYDALEVTVGTLQTIIESVNRDNGKRWYMS